MPNNLLINLASEMVMKKMSEYFLLKKEVVNLLRKGGNFGKDWRWKCDQRRSRASLDKDPEDWRSQLKLNVEGIG